MRHTYLLFFILFFCGNIFASYKNSNYEKQLQQYEHDAFPVKNRFFFDNTPKDISVVGGRVYITGQKYVECQKYFASIKESSETCEGDKKEGVLLEESFPWKANYRCIAALDEMLNPENYKPEGKDGLMQAAKIYDFLGLKKEYAKKWARWIVMNNRMAELSDNFHAHEFVKFVLNYEEDEIPVPYTSEKYIGEKPEVITIDGICDTIIFKYDGNRDGKRNHCGVKIIAHVPLVNYHNIALLIHKAMAYSNEFKEVTTKQISELDLRGGFFDALDIPKLLHYFPSLTDFSIEINPRLVVNSSDYEVVSKNNLHVSINSSTPIKVAPPPLSWYDGNISINFEETPLSRETVQVLRNSQKLWTEVNQIKNIFKYIAHVALPVAELIGFGYLTVFALRYMVEKNIISFHLQTSDEFLTSSLRNSAVTVNSSLWKNAWQLLREELEYNNKCQGWCPKIDSFIEESAQYCIPGKILPLFTLVKVMNTHLEIAVKIEADEQEAEYRKNSKMCKNLFLAFFGVINRVFSYLIFAAIFGWPKHFFLSTYFLSWLFGPIETQPKVTLKFNNSYTLIPDDLNFYRRIYDYFFLECEPADSVLH